MKNERYTICINCLSTIVKRKLKTDVDEYNEAIADARERYQKGLEWQNVWWINFINRMPSGTVIWKNAQELCEECPYELEHTVLKDVKNA